ncbi:hypothetical protein [Streptomyces sp. NPDC049881]|uniref:hypothetical protein n=1 Tax=Streptomyces sp. NPDC049881 TaxID=3155778 RepID=UPI003445A30E
MADLLADLLVRLGIDDSGLTDGAQGAADDVGASLSGIAGVAAGGAVGAMFVAGLSSAMDISSVETQLANQLDLTADEAERAGDVAGDVYAAGFGGSLAEVGETVSAVVSSIGDMSEVTDAELTEMTRSAEALAGTFQFDVGESAEAAGALIRSGMAEDGVEAMDLLAATAQQVPAAMREEVPALTREYAEFFDQLGFTGPQMMGLLAEAAENPLFELDKLGDAVKEFTLLLADTEAVSEPLEQLGLDVEEIQALVNEGQGTQAFDTVIEALRGVEDQSERTALQAALFGGPGEDMGNTLLEISAAGVDARTGLDSAAGAASGMADAMEASPAQQMDAAMRQLQMTLGTLLLPVVQAASGFFAQNSSVLQVAIPVVLALAAGLGIASIAMWAMNSALLASPITWIIVGVTALVAAIVYLATQTNAFQTLWSGAMDAIGVAWDWTMGLIRGGIEWVTWAFLNFTGPGLLIQHFDSIKRAVGSAIGWVEDRVDDGVGWVEDRVDDLRRLPGRVVDWFTGVGESVGNSVRGAFRGSINAVIGGWNRLSIPLPSVDLGPLGTIGGGSINFPDIPYLASGGITTGPTLAMIGEGREQEAVLPLSRLDSMLASVAPAVSRAGGGGGAQRVILELAGPEEMRRLIRMVVDDGGGDVQTVLGRGGRGR